MMSSCGIPWAAPKARITLRLECQLLRMCKAMTQKEAAAQIGMPTSTLADLLHAAIRRLRAGHKIRGIKQLGIDEISYKKGRKYLTIVYDLDRYTRSPDELGRWIEAAESTGVKIHTTGDLVDLADDDSIFKARILLAVAEKESANISRRVTAQARHAAEAVQGAEEPIWRRAHSAPDR